MALAPAYKPAKLLWALQLLAHLRSSLMLLVPRWPVIPGNRVELSTPLPDQVLPFLVLQAFDILSPPPVLPEGSVLLPTV